MKRQVKASVGRSVGYSVSESVGEAPTTLSSSFQGMLDLYPAVAPVAAYSVARRLTVNYSGPLIRVRRSSDNAETDIRYVDSVSAVLDTAALTSFVGASNGLVVRVYDQSGNARDWSQATAGIQPTIVSLGAVNTMGTNLRPAMQHGTGARLDSPSMTTASGYVTVFATLRKVGDPAYEVILTKGNVFSNSGVWHIETFDQSVAWRPKKSADALALTWASASATTTSIDVTVVGIANIPTGLRQVSVNGRGTISSTGGSFTATASVFSAAILRIGTDATAANGFTGRSGECVLFAATVSATDIATDTRTFWGIT